MGLFDSFLPTALIIVMSEAEASSSEPGVSVGEVQTTTVQLSDLANQHQDPDSFSNALEVLMGLGAECTKKDGTPSTVIQQTGEAQSQQEDGEEGAGEQQQQIMESQIIQVTTDSSGQMSAEAEAAAVAASSGEGTSQSVTFLVPTELDISKHFKKSRKSEAIIPTRESLGIISPFQKTREAGEYSGSRRFACTKCKMRYKTEDELENHMMKKHERKRKFLCEICGEKLSTRASVRHHVIRKHSDDKELLKCENCDYTTKFPSRMKIHMGKHKADYFCDVCNKSYVSKEKLEAHFNTPMHKNAVNPIICEHCGYSTKKKDNFIVHMRKHTGEKPYKCNQCDYSSADGSSLKKHVMAKHSNIRPFKCDLCTFACVDKKGLTIHMRRHTGERPFKCDHCSYAAKRRSALNVHMQTHTRPTSSLMNKRPQQKTTIQITVTQPASYEGEQDVQQEQIQEQPVIQEVHIVDHQGQTIVGQVVEQQVVDGSQVVEGFSTATYTTQAMVQGASGPEIQQVQVPLGQVIASHQDAETEQSVRSIWQNI